MFSLGVPSFRIVPKLPFASSQVVASHEFK